MNEQTTDGTEVKVTGKQILSECATLACHIGTYLSEAFKQLWSDAKTVFGKRS